MDIVEFSETSMAAGDAGKWITASGQDQVQTRLLRSRATKDEQKVRIVGESRKVCNGSKRKNQTELASWGLKSGQSKCNGIIYRNHTRIGNQVR